MAFWEGEWGALVENLSTTVLPADTRERVAMLLILATAVVSVDGREALARGLEYVTRAEALVVRSGDDPVAEVNCSKARLLCFFFAGEFGRAAGGRRGGRRRCRARRGFGTRKGCTCTTWASSRCGRG